VNRIDVACESRAEGGWTCRVRVDDATEHNVGITRADLERLSPASSDPEDLVRRSFEFLLAREPKESILRSFDLPVIGRYFPEFEREITRPSSSGTGPGIWLGDPER
jgi:hypothetical protein